MAAEAGPFGPPEPRVEIRRSADRPCTRTDGLTSRHSLSFGGHYDPQDTSFGLLLAHNEDVVQPGAGYDDHPHRGIETVTWVLSGWLIHGDQTGAHGVVGPGMVQRMSAGSGVVHSERNASPAEPVHFVQMWVVADPAGGEPGYAHADVGPALADGGLVLVAAGDERRAPFVTIRQPAAELLAARLPGSGSVDLPAAPYVHLFVARGAATLHIGARRVDLAAGDAVRSVHPTGGAGPLLTDGPDGAEVLVWVMTQAVLPG